MIYCPNCKVPISGRNYRFCPSCRQIISELVVQCPSHVFVGVAFEVVFSVKGIMPISVDSFDLNDKPRIKVPLEIRPGEPKTIKVTLHTDGRFALDIKSQNVTITKTVDCRPVGAFSVIWQNNQIVKTHNDGTTDPIYISWGVTERLVVPSEDTKRWINIASFKIVCSDGLTFEFAPSGNGFIICEDFIDWVKTKEVIQGTVRVGNRDGLQFDIPGLMFHYHQDLPYIKLIHDDYLNAIKLGANNNSIKYSLSYVFDDVAEVRPIDKVYIKYQTDMMRKNSIEKFFNDKQRIEEKVDVDISKLTPGPSDTVNIFHLEFLVSYEVNGIDRTFSSFFDIPFIVRNTSGPSKPQPTGFMMAVDFGTSNTCIAVLHNESTKFLNTAPYTTLFDAVQMLPTIIMFDKLGDPPPEIIHYAQAISGNRQPLTFAANFKPRLVNNDSLFYYDQQLPRNTRHFTPSDLMSMYLEHMKSELEGFLGHDIRTTMISYPADFSDEIRCRVHDTFQSVGLNTNLSVTLSEPENIALYFAMEPDSPIKRRINDTGSATICVFDCGGGTTDVSVVRVSEESGNVCFEVLATWGTDEFSGNYITYMIGKQLDGNEDWFPHDFSRLYTAKNEELEEYFKLHQHYEAIKCNNLDANYDLSIREGLGPLIKSKISDVFGLIKSNILMKLFDFEVLCEMDTDFLILAGNSCKLEWFNSIAQDEFTGSEIIWDPEKGKAAVVLGALTACQMSGSLEIKGLSLSRYEYYYRHGFNLRRVFRSMINMDKEEIFTSDHIQPMEIKILGKKFIEQDENHLSIMFHIPKPEKVRTECKYRFRLKYLAKKFSYCWIAEEAGTESVSEYRDIPNTDQP